jgi:hypothetical protein
VINATSNEQQGLSSVNRHTTATGSQVGEEVSHAQEILTAIHSHRPPAITSTPATTAGTANAKHDVLAPRTNNAAAIELLITAPAPLGQPSGPQGP